MRTSVCYILYTRTHDHVYEFYSSSGDEELDYEIFEKMKELASNEGQYVNAFFSANDGRYCLARYGVSENRKNQGTRANHEFSCFVFESFDGLSFKHIQYLFVALKNKNDEYLRRLYDGDINIGPTIVFDFVHEMAGEYYSKNVVPAIEKIDLSNLKRISDLINTEHDFSQSLGIQDFSFHLHYRSETPFLVLLESVAEYRVNQIPDLVVVSNVRDIGLVDRCFDSSCWIGSMFYSNFDETQYSIKLKNTVHEIEIFSQSKSTSESINEFDKETFSVSNSLDFLLGENTYTQLRYFLSMDQNELLGGGKNEHLEARLIFTIVSFLRLSINALLPLEQDRLYNKWESELEGVLLKFDKDIEYKRLKAYLSQDFFTENIASCLDDTDKAGLPDSVEWLSTLKYFTHSLLTVVNLFLGKSNLSE